VRDERQRNLPAPRLLRSILKIQPLMPGAFCAMQLILLSTGMQVQDTMTAVVSHALTIGRRVTWMGSLDGSRRHRDRREY
jgi:hypothetical protein